MSIAADLEWPAHFPADCPPQDADALSGMVYMLVATDPPTARDMECAMDRGSYKNDSPCLRAALSCARSRNHLEELRERFPRLRKHAIGAAPLAPEHGKIKQTRGHGHYSMWLRAKHLRVGHTLFQVDP